MKTLKQSKQILLKELSEAIDAMILEIELNDFQNKHLTLSKMTAQLAPVIGVDKLLLQLIMSNITEKSNTHYLVKGRYGGIKQGVKPNKITKQNSKQYLILKNKQLTEQLENLMKKLNINNNLS